MPSPCVPRQVIRGFLHGRRLMRLRHQSAARIQARVRGIFARQRHQVRLAAAIRIQAGPGWCVRTCAQARIRGLWGRQKVTKVQRLGHAASPIGRGASEGRRLEVAAQLAALPGQERLKIAGLVVSGTAPGEADGLREDGAPKVEAPGRPEGQVAGLGRGGASEARAMDPKWPVKWPLVAPNASKCHEMPIECRISRRRSWICWISGPQELAAPR